MSLELQIKYVNLKEAGNWLWKDNPKKNDLDKIIASINKFGFRDPPAFDPKLNDGAGGIVEGNHRVRALLMMQSSGMVPPKHIICNQDSEWFMPIVFGADSDSQFAAQAYGIDHNNLTLHGFTAKQVAQIWDEAGYKDLLKKLSNQKVLPTSISDKALSQLLKSAKPVEEGESDDEKGKGKPKPLKIFLTEQQQRLVEDALAQTGHSDKGAALAEIAHYYLS